MVDSLWYIEPLFASANFATATGELKMVTIPALIHTVFIQTFVRTILSEISAKFPLKTPAVSPNA